MIRAALTCLATTAHADDITCMMENGETLAFAIDRNQFVAPQDPNDPPRRKISQVTFGDMRFPAEPFLIGPVRGFHADGLGGSSVMFSVAADGTATYANTRSGETLTGTCEDR